MTTNETTEKLQIVIDVDVDGDPDEMFKLLCEYLTHREMPIWEDYGPEAWGGYEGPFIRNVEVRRA